MITVAAFAVDFNPRRVILTPELDGVPNQVLPQHREKGGVTEHLGKRAVSPNQLCPGFLHRHRQIAQRGVQGGAEVDDLVGGL